MEIGINHLRRMAITWQKRMNLKNGIIFIFIIFLLLFLLLFLFQCLIFGMCVSED
ncbi:hypothetical protein BDV36DRAFT_267116 [Aspergillus pseudocaelatus]|uniref:Uncharacterized protein n=1 Tax=Aspergillus pseudocaelatus TaxID=1825620 RepID=A0ABQ6W9P5_9EURO|nr:hypothetical protein BDV36DRAFT_267116 [Aspergillus pseudocaelatus]